MIHIISAVLVFLVFIYIIMYLLSKRKICLVGHHCLITGGSSGIGLALAVEAAKSGANVTIIARSEEKLKTAKETVYGKVKNQNQKVQIFSADICGQKDILEDIVNKAEESAAPITLLINCAGTSVCSPFLETPIQEFSKMLDVNYLGSVYMTRAVLPLMKDRKNGTIIFVSSLAGVMGLYGYTAYSASKFAIVGMAEALQMEVKPYNINITVSFPPDTDTPGFAEEIKNKPIETVCISESAGLFSAEAVATKMLRDALNKKFISSVGLEGWVLCTAACGMTPVHSFFDLILQVMTMNILRLIGVVFLSQCDRIIKKCAAEKLKLPKEKEKST